jgi:hypothetical protein
VGGAGGAASATALAEGLGTVNVSALAEGGHGYEGALGGAAHAFATASGADGSATASASSNGGSIASLLATASAPVGSQVSSEAAARVGGEPLELAPTSGVQAFALAQALPTAVEPATLASSAPLALLTLGGAAPGGEDDHSILLQASVELALAAPESALLDSLVVDFLDPHFSGDGFEDLDLIVERNGTALLDRHFGDLADALAFFGDGEVDLGPWSGDVDLCFALSLRLDDSDSSFSFGAALGTTPVPEPSALALVALGLALLALRRVRA